MSPTPPASDADQARLVRWFQEVVAIERARRRRSAYAGWPQRRTADALQTRWPLFLRDPVHALLRVRESGRYVPPRAADGTPLRADARAAARVVVTALALEDA